MMGRGDAGLADAREAPADGGGEVPAGGTVEVL